MEFNSTKFRAIYDLHEKRYSVRSEGEEFSHLTIVDGYKRPFFVSTPDRVSNKNKKHYSGAQILLLNPIFRINGILCVCLSVTLCRLLYVLHVRAHAHCSL